MSKHETTSQKGIPGWYITFQQDVLAALPRPPQLDQDMADGWHHNRESLKRVFASLLPPQPQSETSPPAVSTLKFPPLQAADEFEGWLLRVLTFELTCHLEFFGRVSGLAEFEATLKKYGREKIKSWLALDLEPHFLPKVAMARDARFAGWKVRPDNWYWQQLAAGKILRNRNGELVAEAAELEGITVLLDTRLKPRYKNSKQMWESDTLLGQILIQFREAGKIAKYKYGSQGSRFGVSADEWKRHIRPALAGKLGLQPSQVRLERTIEANVIPQFFSYMPRKDDGKTGTWVWYEEYFGDRSDRLRGGRSGGGGLADVFWDGAWGCWCDGSFRPLAVL